ncbi:MAG: hypothetical protein A2161_05920 [Candidatus Schekmanbacteria bacterium RBG_13_48_7]|uniref:CopG family transcriptional regulator n=1 Tax=Candidatus Schekmanbacteria bacterium RBG_13_48_7 TaxID=1817878 RepID=A0A1F7RT55_9BACT|nr:MAG: hypothetical protein A2161_05920 [Candidatus Schekmanbacteria bacterium RBG_13_48_7]
MTNITLKIDEELLRKARKLAAERNTSLNALFNRTVQEFVERNSNRETVLQGLDFFFKKSRARVGKKHWTRDELHERKDIS